MTLGHFSCILASLTLIAVILMVNTVGRGKKTSRKSKGVSKNVVYIIRVQFSPGPFCFFPFIETTIRAVNNITRYQHLIVAYLGRFFIVMGSRPRKLKAY